MALMKLSSIPTFALGRNGIILIPLPRINALILSFLLVFSFQSTFGQIIQTLNPWSHPLAQWTTATTAQTTTYAVPTGSNTSRLLVVAIASSQTATGTARTIVVTYGGQTLTAVNGDLATTGSRVHTELYYLNESGLDAATAAANTTLSVTTTGGTGRVNDVFVAVFDGVDQTTPITNSQNFNNAAIASSPFVFGTALNVGVNGLAIEVISSLRSGNTTPATITNATNWSTAGVDQTFNTTDGVRNSIASRTVPSVATTDVSSTTLSVATLGSMTAMTLNAITTRSWYSYKTGNFNDYRSWTLDPSGSTFLNGLSAIPNVSDDITILNGKTITYNVNNVSLNSAAIQNGAILDMSTTTGHNLGTVTGAGTLRIKGIALPSGTYTDFVSTTGGTVEYYNDVNNSALTLPTGQLTYNNLKLTNSNAGASSVTFISANGTAGTPLTINGTFTIGATAATTNTVTWQINDNTNNLRTITIAGDLIVNTNGKISAGTGRAGASATQHSLTLSRNLTNSGVIQFFDPTQAPFLAADPRTLAVWTAALQGNAVNVTFSGTSDATVTCNGQTDFYRLILNKGAVQVMLTVNSSSTSNFRFFGPSNLGANTSPTNTWDYTSNDALSIVSGTLQLTGNIDIPVLEVSDNVTPPTNGTGYFPIPRNGALWLNGANVTLQLTDTSNPAGNSKDGRILMSGLLRVTAGTINNGFGKGLGSQDGGTYWQEGGTVNCWQFRPKATGSGVFSYIQTGGTLNVGRGFALSGGLVDQFEKAYCRFDLNSATSTFQMSGNAILNVAKPTVDSVGTTGGPGGGLFHVTSSAANVNVTGGTVNFYMGVERSNNLSFPGYITSTAPLYNVNIYEESATPQTAQLQSDLVVLNNLTIDGTNAPALICSNNDLTIGGNFTINSGAKFNPSSGLTGTLAQASENFGGITNSTYYNVAPNSTTGSGSGALFTIVIAGNNVSSITISSPGDGYKSGDQITFLGTNTSFIGTTRTGSAVYNIGAANIVAPANTITFNGSGAQTWTHNGTITNLNAVVVNKSAGTLTLGGTQVFPSIGTTTALATTTGGLTLTSGTLDDGGKTITVEGALNNSATHTGSGAIKLTTNAAAAAGFSPYNYTRTIGGFGGTFGNLSILTNTNAASAATTFTVSTSGNQTISGNLVLDRTAAYATSTTLNIVSNNLTVLGTISSSVGLGANYCVQTSGLHNAGGLSRKGAAGDILFPFGSAAVGANAAVAYTPITINVTASTHGTITARPVNSEHPNVTTTGMSLKYYWRVTSSGYSGITAVSHKTYNFSTAVQGTVTGALTGNLTPNTSTLTGMTAGTYTNVSATSGGTGTGAKFTVVVGSATTITSITVASGGSGYVAGDVLTFAGSLFGGASTSTFNITGPNIIASATTNYVAARYDRTLNNWSKNNTPQAMTGNIIQPNPFNTGTGWTLGAGVVGDQLDGEYTCGIGGAFGGFTTFYSRASANWNVNSTWSTVAVGGVAATSNPTSCPTCPVIIGDGTIGNGHTVTCVAASSCGSLAINANATLDCGTFTGHNFGTSTGGVVSGTGTLRIAAIGTGVSSMFPAGDFTNFLGSNGGTVEWYGATKTIPTTGPAPQNLSLSTYYNLVLNPNSGTTITLPASNLTVYNDVTQGNPNTYSGKVLTNGTQTISIVRDITIAAGTFNFSQAVASAVTMTVGRNTYVGNGATFGVQGGGPNVDTFTTPGSITNDGTINFRNGSVVDVTFTGSNNVNFDGSGSGGTTLDFVTVNKGASQSPTVTFSVGGTVTAANTGVALGWLRLVNGSFIFNNAGTYIISSFNSSYAIPSTANLTVNQGTVTILSSNTTAADLLLNGSLTVSGTGVVNVGTVPSPFVGVFTNTLDNDIEYAATGTPTINVSGTTSQLNVCGSIRRSTSTITGALVYNQTGGATTVGGNASNNTRGVFEIDANTGSSFTMTNSSSLTVQRQTGGTGYADLYINPITSNVAATSTINIGLTTATTQNNLRVNIVPTVGNFAVLGGGNAQTVKLYEDLAVGGTLAITSPSILDATPISPDANVTIAGDFNCTGTYTGGTNTTTFNGSGAQSAGLTSNTQFYNVTVNKSAGTVTVSGTAPAAPGLNNLNILSGTLEVGNAGNPLTNTLKVNRNITINGTQIGTQAIEVYSTSGISNTITSSGGAFTNLILGGTVANTTVSISGNLTINGTLNLLNTVDGATNRYLNIASSQLSFGSAAVSPTNPGSTAFIRTNGVASDLGVVKTWASSGTFLYAVGTSTNYTPVSYSLNVTSTGTLTVVPVNSAHNTAVTSGTTDFYLNYYWTVTRSSSFAASPSGNFTFKCPSSLLSGSTGALVPGYLDPNSLASNGGWVTNVASSTAVNSSGTITLTFPSTPTTDFPSISPYFYDYSAGTTTTLPNPIQGVYSRKGTGTPPIGAGGGNWSTGTNWTFRSDGDPTNAFPGSIYSNPFYTYPHGLPVTILPGTQINMDVDGLIAYKTTINGVLYNVNTAGHNLGAIDGTGTLRTATGNLPAGTYTAFVSSTGGTIEYAATTTMDPRTTYNNLIISNSATTPTPATVTMTAANLTINGNLTINSGNTLDDGVNTTGFGGISIGGNFVNAGIFAAGTSTAISIAGNLTNSGTLNGSSSTVNLTGNLQNSGTFNGSSSTVNLTGNFQNTGTINGGSGLLNLAGNFSNSGTFSAGTGTVSFNGIAAQTITGATTFNNLTINNTFATAPQVTVASGNQTVGSTFKSTKGLLNLNSTTLTIGTTCGTPGAVSHSTLSSAGWVYGGSVTRYFNTTAISDGSLTGFFPIGTSVDFRPFAISVPAGDMSICGTFTLSVGASTATSNVSISDPTNTVSPIVRQYQGAWTVSSSGVSGGTYNIIAGGSGFGTIGSLSDMTLSKATTAVGSYVLATANSTADPRMERTGLSLADIISNDGSQFFVGSTNAIVSPLPIELISFTGESKNYGVDLQWKTASEMNNDYFTVSRSATGANFESIGTVKGNGTTSSLHTYSLIDYKPILGKNYYQLKQTDFDNHVTTSETIVVKVLSLEPLISIYPNPLSQNQLLNVAMNGLEVNTPTEIQIVNVQGTAVKKATANTDSDGSLKTSLDLTGLSAGLYILKIQNVHYKFIIE